MICGGAGGGGGAIEKTMLEKKDFWNFSTNWSSSFIRHTDYY